MNFTKFLTVFFTKIFPSRLRVTYISSRPSPTSATTPLPTYDNSAITHQQRNRDLSNQLLFPTPTRPSSPIDTTEPIQTVHPTSSPTQTSKPTPLPTAFTAQFMIIAIIILVVSLPAIAVLLTKRRNCQLKATRRQIPWDLFLLFLPILNLLRHF